MTSETPRDLTAITVRLAAVWVAAGALFKLLAGTPNDLPPVLHGLPVSIDLFFKLAVGIELAIVCTAILRPKLAWIPLVGLFTVFDVILAISLAGGEESCGCFGSSITIPPAVMMAIDSLLLLGILFSKPWASDSKGFGPALALPVLAIGSLILPFPYVGDQTPLVSEDGEATKIEELRYVILKVEEWKDQLIYDTDFAALFPAQIETLPTDGTYIFWRWDCDHCATHLQQLADEDDMSQPIVLIRLGQDSDNEENRAVFAMPTGGHVTELLLPAGPQYVVETPADFILQGGMVIRGREGIKTDEH
jgi:hypothetical protein